MLSQTAMPEPELPHPDTEVGAWLDRIQPSQRVRTGVRAAVIALLVLIAVAACCCGLKRWRAAASKRQLVYPVSEDASSPLFLLWLQLRFRPATPEQRPRLLAGYFHIVTGGMFQ